MNRTDLIPATVLAACVMHNICLNNNDVDIAEYEEEGMRFLNVENNEEQHEVQNVLNNNIDGVQFRDNLCRMLNNRRER